MSRNSGAIHFIGAHVSGIAQAVEPDEPAYPVHIRFFGAQAVMLVTSTTPDLVEELGWLGSGDLLR